MPGTRCAVTLCNNSLAKTKVCEKTRHIAYHTFPADILLRKRWILRTRRAGELNPDTSRICSVHFTPDDYERDLAAELLNLPPKKVLKKTAVPSLLLGINFPKNKKREEKRLRRSRKKIVSSLLKGYESQQRNRLDEGSSMPLSLQEQIDHNCKYVEEVKELTKEKQVLLSKLENTSNNISSVDLEAS